MNRAVVLLSGGQDSTTCLFWARERFDALFALSFDYGQRHRAELEAAVAISKLAGAELFVADLEVLRELADSALVNPDLAIEPSGGHADSEAPGGLPTSFVPGRNILFLAVAASYAVKVGAKDIVTGVCQTDYSGYPDCRAQFVEAMQLAVNEGMPSSAGPLAIRTPLMNMTKAESVKLARSLPGCLDALAYSVTCYHGKRPGCGECPACMLRAQGFDEAAVEDPASRCA